MTSLARTVEHLESRRSALTQELATIDAQLRAIAQALRAHEAPTGLNGRASKPVATAPSKSSPTRRAGAKKPRRSWFARDEAGKLLRRAARTPKAAADLVREVADTKGFAGTLSADDLRRFQGATYMAIAQALKSKALKRRSDGTLVAA